MAAEALATRRRIIPRPRLTRLLDESSARIKLLVAPAGYGKTTLAQQWLAEPRRRDVWYRGGSASADVAALAAGISIAASEIVPDAGKRMRQRLRAASHPEGDVEVLADLLAEDAQDWPKDSWICVDDYQYAMESPAPEWFIELLIQSTPIQMVVTSRRRPTWATARRILYGELQELDRRTLAMEPEEGKIVIGRVDGDVAALLAQARGWPAVIALASTARRIAPPQEGLPPALYDYFAEELYQQLSPALQAALCRLCVAPVITAELRHLLLGDGDGEAIETALRLGVVEEQRGRFEMHPLIRSFLEAKLAAAGEIDSLTLARRVIDHLITCGSWDEAFDVVARFQIHDRLEPLIAAAVEEIIESGRLTTLSQWLEFAARHHLEAPVLDFAEAELAFRHGLYGTAAALAAGAAHAAVQASKYEPPLYTRMHLRAGQSALLDSREADALHHFQQAARIAPDGSLSREALIGQFFSSVDLGLDEAERLLIALEGISTRGPEDLVRLSIARMLYAERTGGLADVIARARDVYPLLERTSDPVIKTSFLNSYGQSLVLMAWYERALHVAEETERAAGEYRLQFVFSHAAILRAMASIGLRDVSAALRAITDADQGSDDPHITAVAAILRARVSLLRGDPDDALSILSRPLYRRPSDAMYSEYLASRALVSAVVGDTVSAVELCEEVLAAPKFARGGATTARLLKSIAADEQTESDPEAMRAAIDFVLEGGRLDEFVTVYRSFPELLRFALTDSAYHEVTTAIIRRSNDGRMARALGLSVKGPLAGPLGRLTPREREVLALVTQGLTNKGIAKRLVISEPTVKVHVRHVLEKLGAATRAEAAAKFAQLPIQATDATANGPSST